MLRYAGLPQDAIEAICDIYTNVRTQVRVPAGTTAPIPVNRGVIQGDVISPIIFYLFLEPMLKWLHEGEAGYTPSCLTVKISELGYADDLSLLNTSAAAAQRQLNKVHRFANWAGMDLNVKKCAHTALVPSPARKGLLQLAPDGKTTSAVQWKGTPLPYLSPHEPYKYRGVWTALDLNTKTQLACLKDKLDAHIANIVNSEARGIDALTVIRETVLPCVEHAMAAAVLPLSDVCDLQKTLNQAYRKALGISRSTSGDMLTLPVLQGGFGLPSLSERYVNTTTRTIRCVINDAGIPGQLGRAVLDRQLRKHGKSKVSIQHSNWTNLCCPWTRKFKMLFDSKVDAFIDVPAELGGEPDALLSLLTRALPATPATVHVPHLRRLWALGLTSVEQLTVPGTS
jgi:hypothetical protein